MIKKNDIINLDIIDLSNSGDGIARYENLVIFIPNALPKDRIKAGITKVNKKYAYARIIDFIEKSPYRIDPPFGIHDKCGGCVLQHLSYSSQLKFKQNTVVNNLKRIGGFENIKVNAIIGMQYPYFYRNKVQYPLYKDKYGKISYGFYAPHSHRIIPNNSCLIQNKMIDKYMSIICEELNLIDMDIYDENIHSGYLRHVVIRHSSLNNTLMVCFVINSKSTYSLVPIVEKLKNDKNIVSIIANINTENTNVILGKTNKLLYGCDYIEDKIGDTHYKISLPSFFQVNEVQNEILYNQILKFANFKGTENVVDLYCGIGSIGLYISKYVKKIIGIEIVPEAITNAKDNADINNISNVQFYSGDATDVFHSIMNNIKPIDFIIVDPPRKGLTKTLIDDISKISPKNIIYVSCDSATLARDLRYMVDNGYEINAVQPVDMFPHTTHVECVCLITRTQ